MDFKTLPSKETNGGIQYIFKADNGYGASIVKHDFSYGGREGLWELAVIQFEVTGDWDICYDTPVTNDVLGHLSDDEVNELLIKIQNL